MKKKSWLKSAEKHIRRKGIKQIDRDLKKAFQERMKFPPRQHTNPGSMDKIGA